MWRKKAMGVGLVETVVVLLVAAALSVVAFRPTDGGTEIVSVGDSGNDTVGPIENLDQDAVDELIAKGFSEEEIAAALQGVEPGESGTGEPGQPGSGQPGQPGPGQPGQPAPGQPGPVPPGDQTLQCAPGRNGGNTDVGVTATEIKLGATTVQSGDARKFLEQVPDAMNAVVNKVNAAGGICGRRLNLVTRDDGFDPARGKGFLENFVEQEKVFALAVVPSSEGLREVSTTGYLEEQGVPVVGTNGLLASQYTNSMIWPVATSTISSVHIMVQHACDRGVKNFSIVYDSEYRFGKEGAFAFNESVKRCTGSGVPGYSNPLTNAKCDQRFCGIRGGGSGTDANSFNSACGGTQVHRTCDFTLFLMEPDSAHRWKANGGMKVMNGAVAGGPQPLFNSFFATGCDSLCNGMWVWTGFTPPIGDFANQPAVSTYVQDVRRQNASIDPTNAFVQGGYIGMQQLVEAIRKVGPDLTRERLIAALNSLQLDTGMAKPLTWSANDRFANRCMMAFSIESAQGFSGFKQETGFICDPNPNLDVDAAQ